MKAVIYHANARLAEKFEPGTYYIRLINNDGATATGIFRARWEEQP